MSPIAGGGTLLLLKKRIFKKSYLISLQNQICLLNCPAKFLSKNVRININKKDCSNF